MAEKKKKDSTGNNKVQFIVVREFAGKQTMKEAFEHLIEKQTCRQFEEWLDKIRAGAWYYNSVMSLFIEGEHYEQEIKTKSENNCPLLQAVP